MMVDDDEQENVCVCVCAVVLLRAQCCMGLLCVESEKRVVVYACLLACLLAGFTLSGRKTMMMGERVKGKSVKVRTDFNP